MRAARPNRPARRRPSHARSCASGNGRHAWTPGAGADLGVVVSALDEAESLPGLLADLSGLQLAHEVVVVDGGSRDCTVGAARSSGAWVMRSRRGRARQFNAGAAFLGSRWLLLLHADTRLDDRALRAVERHATEDPRHAGYFKLAIAHPHFFYRLIEAGQRVRERCARLVYGDQGLLIRRDAFWKAGGYPDQPLMEDVVLNRRLARAGRLARLPACIRTSARRYEEEGRLRAFGRNAMLISRFLAGADPAVLARRYPARRAPMPSDESVAPVQPASLLIFAKAPRPGNVKTRLAQAWGADAAAEAYRRLGRRIVDQLADAPAQTIVCFDPPDGDGEVRAWLEGSGAKAFVPQGDGDLGARMSRMVDAAFARGARTVVVVGTDAPAVGAGAVARALDALRSADVVVGPSRDGGYYLIGLKAPQPTLFRDVRWSTEHVFRETTNRCAELGLRITCLPVERDIDAPSDVTPDMAASLGMSLRAVAAR